ERVLGDELAEVFAALHRARGVDFHFRAKVTAVAPDRVELADGTVLNADAVLVAVGVQPDTVLAEQAGLAVDNGVLVDASLRTEDPNIYAAGDVANVSHLLLGTRIRVEHWANGLNAGPAPAGSMLVQAVSCERPRN